ncbi:Deoxyuridine 5'-triphosphate nucleotidohydrolase [Aedoeadaptatus ivorii]|uniref:Deoxyuridine 5'-triphosphate nucleotidohydrolase n=1 Tax=Aedoeadaptatus ivorii TaxID=54006 RepID=A0A448V1P2_9FIRM|nr:dUTP diphosphatase [Peptoniphilus ivorii]MDQ0507820.1 dUTP pyrophosphatase [Peptoniphilus ivorii]VEJ35647.1 Deoxyuridine 5'-triphosphate nucleotidohydrolase [Peptoniphilus ivorii]
MKIKIVNRSKHPLPAYATEGASGMDLRADLDEDLAIAPFERIKVPTGLYLELPEGIEGQVRARSGLSFKKGITLINAVGTVDSDYRGEITVPLVNLSQDTVVIQDGERIAQLVLARYEKADLIEVEELEELDKTARGKGGFGHTGRL